MPWLIGAALLHSVIVTEKRENFAAWTALLAVLAFLFSIMGAFLVRSGVLTSVHAFAVDPTRGTILLFGLMVYGVLALGPVRLARAVPERRKTLADRQPGRRDDGQ
jgi:cytochrome c-type biogenesis protein CcmF